MTDEARLVAATSVQDDEVFDRAIRPKRLEEYVGQESVKRQMRIFITAASKRRAR